MKTPLQFMLTEFIFVYGTLRKTMATARRELLTKQGEYFSDGYLQGKLYDLGQYPGAIESAHSDERVYGELYKITEDGSVLAQLDEYEECSDHFPEPHEHIRKQLPIQLADGSTVNAWVYIYNRGVYGLKQIKSGDYTAYIKTHHHRH